MPHCAAFGCNNNSTSNFFRYPKDKIQLMAWIHYCRHDSVRTFKRSVCLSRKTCRIGIFKCQSRMKLTAVPDISLTLGLGEDLPTDPSGHRTTTVKPKRVRGAYHKRQNAEVLHQALQSYNVNYVLDTPASACALVEVYDAELSIPAFVPVPQAQPQKVKQSVKVQAKFDPTRTSKIQVRAAKSIAIQSELLKLREDSDNENEPSSEDDIDPDTHHDSEYEPHSDTDDGEDSDDNSDFEDMHMNFKLDKILNQ